MVVSGSVRHVGWRKVYSTQFLGLTPLQQGIGQAAGPAAYVQNSLIVGAAHKVQEGRDPSPTPATHLHFIAVTIGWVEC
jgi:hypothetical protein